MLRNSNLINISDQVLISDFGLCKTLSLEGTSCTGQSNFEGTRGWGAPETMFACNGPIRDADVGNGPITDDEPIIEDMNQGQSYLFIP